MPRVIMMNFSVEGVAVNAVVRAQFNESMADEMASVKLEDDVFHIRLISLGFFIVGIAFGLCFLVG